jgi:DNA end-binding protein Ku
MRTIWNGSISFGLVSIPVGLALATKPAARQSDVSFRQLHRECLTPIKQKRWCPTHDREVGPDEIVRGWEVSKGEFVVVEDADLEAIERTEESRSIDITRFVPLASVDPIYFDRTYFLAPSSNAAQRRPYVLLLEAMKGTEMAALGRFILRGQEHFSLIRARGDALVLETLFIAET